MDPAPTPVADPSGDRLLVDLVTSALAHCGPDGWTVRPSTSWCCVEGPDGRTRQQGWKLHLSATPLSAPVVLARSAEVLLRRRCPFKFAPTLDRVEELVSRQYDRSSGGKFITAYPDMSDDELRTLAQELHEATVGLPGPSILSDRPYRPGSSVYYRFGAFTALPVLDNDGSYQLMLVAPDGELVPDRRQPWFALPSWAPADPFCAEAEGRPRSDAAATATATGAVVLDGRYVIRAVVRHAFTGGVYRADDRVTGAPVIVKQARPHTGATLTGRDVCDVRRHEAEMLDLLEPSGLTPRRIGTLEQQGDLFVVQEELPGPTLRQWVADSIDSDQQATWGIPSRVALGMAGGLVTLVEAVHGHGLVIRDFTPNNVIVTPSGDLRLIDLELLATPGQAVVRSSTPGYAAPEQTAAPRIGPAPQQSADLYSLGATLFYLVTGVDPLLPLDRPATRSTHDRLERWLSVLSEGNPAAVLLGPVIVALLHDDPALRPPLEEVRASLARLQTGDPCAGAGARVGHRHIPGPVIDSLITDAVDHLVATLDPDGGPRLFASGPYGTTTDPLNVQHGAAGVLGVLVRAYETAPTASLRTAVVTSARWIADRIDPRDNGRRLPGLYFGRSGTAWALLEAGRVLGEEALVRLAEDLAREVPVAWPNPDVCHGAAGAGLTQLRFWEVTGDVDFLASARRAADALVSSARIDHGQISWPIPDGFDSALAGKVHYGFAHGLAGIGAFLLAAARTTGERAYRDAATAAAETLAAVARVDRGAALWLTGRSRRARRTSWCSGSSGIGTFLVRMWQDGGDDRFRRLAVQAAAAVRRYRRKASTAQCHGLAGDGEFLLDLADALDDRQYVDWALDLAVHIHARHCLLDGRAVAPDETGFDVVGDFGTGSSGVLAFLLRLRHGGPRLWLPDSLRTRCRLFSRRGHS